VLLLLQAEHEKKEEALQKEIDRYRSEKTKLETEKKMKQDRMVCCLLSLSFLTVCFCLLLNFRLIAVLHCSASASVHILYITFYCRIKIEKKLRKSTWN